MGVTAAVITAVAAAGGATYSAVQQNQQVQHAKGAAQAQKTAADAQVAAADKQTQANKDAKKEQASTTQAAAIAALRASMSAASGAGGSILTSPQGSAPAPTGSKSLLGI